MAALMSPLMATGARAVPVSADIGKNLEYLQVDNAGTTVPIGPSNAFFFARTFYATGDYDGGNLQFDSTTLNFNSTSTDCCGHTGVQYGTTFITKAQMDADFPTSTVYTLHLTDSTHVNPDVDIQVNLPPDLYNTTPVPTFTSASFDALNGLTPGQALTVFTDPFTVDANATGGQTFLSIFDITDGTNIYSDFGTNTRASWDIGSGLFLAGHQYEAQLIYDNLVQGSDGLVPTTARSDLRTDVIFSLPGGVPEPASWAMLLIGLGAVGAGIRSARYKTAGRLAKI